VVGSLIIIDPRRPFEVTAFSVLGQRILWLGLPWHEPWRLITPVLVHFDGWHILFNMLWLRDLGRIVEGRHGARHLLSFVLVSGILSNIAQYQIAQNPLFGGMSGVVYGLLGMIWVRGRIDPRAGYGLSRFTVQAMLLWMAIGFISPRLAMANWCHLFGLLVGVVWGFVGARHAR